MYVFAVNMLEGPSVTNTWAQYYQITYPMLWDGVGAVMDSYEVVQTMYKVPIVIDQDTIIQYRTEDTLILDGITNKIEELLHTGVTENEVVTSLTTTGYSICQNYPNPFKIETSIKYTLPKVSKVELIVYNALGQEVKTLLNRKQEAGYYIILWDGEDENCNIVPSGIYFCRIKVDNWEGIIKILSLR